MSRSMIGFFVGIVVAAIVAIFIASSAWANQEQQEEAKPNPKTQEETEEKIEIPSSGPDAIARRDFMRTKLMYSQNIFEGLTTGDFELIQAGIKEVKMVTEGERWVQVDNDHYRKLTEDFKTALQRLSAAADSGNIDATALRYYQMSTSCIDCHKHIRVAKYDF